jgi:hypothetical protein
VESCRRRRGGSFSSYNVDDEENGMRTLRFVAALVLGLALVMGTATVSQAAPASQRALPRCQQFTTFYGDFFGARVHRTLPTTGYENKNTECKLQYGDEYPGVLVLQAAITRCFAKITVDGKYYAETEAVVRFIQELNKIDPDGVYGPDTRDVMGWPWYSSDGTFLFCA